MANIIGVGVSTLDIINEVEQYPQEDDKVRATRQRIARGGNAANTLVVLSLLRHCVHWAGVLTKTPNSQYILNDLLNHKVNISAIHYAEKGQNPTSYITHNKNNGSRTIVNYRDVPEYDLESFQSICLDTFDWIHFEGRNPAETKKMLHHLKQTRPELTCSVEVEKPRPGIEELIPYGDVIIFSRSYAKHTGAKDAESFLISAREKYPDKDLICAWGEKGASGINRKGQFASSQAYPPPQLIDTLGAGDTFNAGIINAYLKEYDFADILASACRLAGTKCGYEGYEFVKDYVSGPKRKLA